jgi:hypothetical protein
LNDYNHRECYESAHSVMLSIFGSYADRKQGEVLDLSARTNHNLVEKLVPYYCKMLLEVSLVDMGLPPDLDHWIFRILKRAN